MCVWHRECWHSWGTSACVVLPTGAAAGTARVLGTPELPEPHVLDEGVSALSLQGKGKHSVLLAL